MMMVFMSLSPSFVALFTRAWIEISKKLTLQQQNAVALFTRAWIEMLLTFATHGLPYVALFTRAWIEIEHEIPSVAVLLCRPLYEGVD